MELKATKAAIMAIALFGLSSAYADNYSWLPHLMPDEVRNGDHRINLWGGATVTIINDSDQTHNYRLAMLLSSPDCSTSDRHGIWEQQFSVSPHSTWQQDHQFNVAIQCDHGGKRSFLDVGIRSSNKLQFQRHFESKFTVV